MATMKIAIFGGLKPIMSRLILDMAAIVMLFFATLSHVGRPMNLPALLGALVLTVSTSGLTAKWTLLFPMIPLVLLQLCRRIEYLETISYITGPVILGLSLLSLCTSIALSILFPAVELADIEGPYNVGVIDMHLPVNFATIYTEQVESNDDKIRSTEKNAKESSTTTDGLVTVRILYPTKEKVGRIPYVRPKGATTFLAESLKFGAPTPLKKRGWILHSWLLTYVKAKFYAKPATADDDDETNKKMPIVLFSHGIGGIGTIYSYQTMSLAANGCFVVAFDHADGSAPVMWKNPQEQKFLDRRPYHVWQQAVKEKCDEKRIQCARMRREMTEFRAKEVLAATFAIRKWNETNTNPQLLQHNVSFVGKLNLDKIIFMGHSHGGATALTAGLRRPELARAIVAHEPANDWAPDDIRRSFIPAEIVKECPYEYTGATGGLRLDQNAAKATIRDMDVLVLWSHEWFSNKWSSSHILDWMHKHGKLLTPNSEVDYIDKAHHTEFSDTCVMTPLWLARKVGLTGERNPLDTGRDIHKRTLQFLNRLDNRTERRRKVMGISNGEASNSQNSSNTTGRDTQHPTGRDTQHQSVDVLKRLGT